MLRVFFLGLLQPDQARVYLEREAQMHESLETLLASINRERDWDADEFTRYGHLVIESGMRYAHAQAEWARWAAERIATAKKKTRA
jgi:hypothetical protein